MTRAQRLSKAITVLARAFRQNPDEFLLEAYMIGLEDVPIEMIEAGVKDALRTSKFMPSPAELSGRVSLRLPGRVTCAACGVRFSFPDSVKRGYCGECWKKVGGEAEDIAREALTHEARKQLNG